MNCILCGASHGLNFHNISLLLFVFLMSAPFLRTELSLYLQGHRIFLKFNGGGIIIFARTSVGFLLVSGRSLHAVAFFLD